MTDTAIWKQGAQICGVVGVASAISLVASLLVSGIFVFAVELVSGAWIERYLGLLVAVSMIALVPFYVGLMTRDMRGKDD